MATSSNSILSADSEKLLRTVFGDDWQDAWVCWKGNMHGKRVKDLLPGELSDAVDCYFSIALLQAGASARTVDNVWRVMAVVIDDIGTKIDKDGFDMLAPPPTWMIETSDGNWQAGYALDGGLDVIGYRLFRLAMADHAVWGNSDMAMDPVHLYRLPQGTNTKNGWRVS